MKYLYWLCSVYDAHQHQLDIRPSTDLSAFEKLLDAIYWTSSCIGWSQNAARESRLRCRANNQYFCIWHCTKLLSVPTSEQPRLYPALPTTWVELKVTKDRCMPALSIRRKPDGDGLPSHVEPRLGLKDELFLKWPSFRAVSVCAAVPHSCGVFWHCSFHQMPWQTSA